MTINFITEAQNPFSAPYSTTPSARVKRAASRKERESQLKSGILGRGSLPDLQLNTETILGGSLSDKQIVGLEPTRVPVEPFSTRGARIGKIIEEIKGLSPEDQMELQKILETLVARKFFHESVEQIRNSASEVAPQAEIRAATINRDEEMKWLTRNFNGYIGRWVVVEGNTLIAVGETAREAYQSARLAGVQIPFLIKIMPEEPMPFGGW